MKSVYVISFFSVLFLMGCTKTTVEEEYISTASQQALRGSEMASDEVMTAGGAIILSAQNKSSDGLENACEINVTGKVVSESGLGLTKVVVNKVEVVAGGQSVFPGLSSDIACESLVSWDTLPEGLSIEERSLLAMPLFLSCTEETSIAVHVTFSVITKDEKLPAGFFAFESIQSERCVIEPDQERMDINISIVLSPITFDAFVSPFGVG